MWLSLRYSLPQKAGCTGGFKAEYVIQEKKLKVLRPILEQWLKINREYIEEGEYEDALYIYNERSTISSLAGAVWKCGGYAQEEYSAKKGEGQNETNGRIDLFFNFAQKNIIIEAKNLWIYLHENNKKDIKKKIEGSLELAEKDIRKTVMANDYGDFNMAVTFIPIYWKEGTNQKQNMKSIRILLKK